jgi:pyruvate dehydrogenase E1 component alpha subunit
MDGAGKVSIAFSGDGACNQGTTFESMNMAVVLKLPVIFVYENNHYSEHTGVEYAVGSKDMTKRSAGFGMLALKADGCDFFSVYDTMTKVLEHARGGNGPVSVEFDTERFFGHFEGDPQRYRGPGELERIRETRDCLKNFRATAKARNLIDLSELDKIDAEVMQLIEAAVTEARAAPVPLAADVLEDVYVSY